MAGEMRTATSDEQIGAIVRGAPEIIGRNVIIGGRSGSGLALASALALKGEGVFFTHSGRRKERDVLGALEEVRDAFIKSGVDADPEVEVIAIGGDAADTEHHDQIVRATSLWLPEKTPITSLTLAAARGTEPQGFGVESKQPDPDYAKKLNVDGVLGVFRKLVDAKTIDGRSLLHGATILYPASTASHQWESIDPEDLKIYETVGPSKWEAEVAMLTEVAERMSAIGGRAVIAVMGIIEGTLVARAINREDDARGYRERPDILATKIDLARAGEGMATIIGNSELYPNRSVVHILSNEIKVEDTRG